MPTPRTTPTSSPRIPAKWLAIIIFSLVAYGLCQPFVNRKLGWKLPSLSSVMGLEQDKSDPKEAPASSDHTTATKPQSASKKSSKAGNEDGSGAQASLHDLSEQAIERQPLDEGKGRSANSSSANPSSSKTPTESNSTNSVNSKNSTGTSPTSSINNSKTSSEPSFSNSTSSKTSAAPSKPQANDSKLLYGFLKDLGREDYASPAGLHYTRGSEEGHRLKHIERHLEDIPDRDGRHGVFDGDMAQVVRWIDDAYTRAKEGKKGTSKREEEMGRMVYEASFSKPIGYIGGREGRRQNNPPAKRIRLVVDDRERVITAFPY